MTRNDDLALDRMYAAKEAKVKARVGKHNYDGSDLATVKSSFKPYPYKKPTTVPRQPKVHQEGPGPDVYYRDLKPGGPQFQFGSRFDDRREPATGVKADGSRFDSSLRQKPHLRPKKVDGPGPGDYQLPSSIKQNNRSVQSFQYSTWGTGRDPDWSENKRKQEHIAPGPAHYNHVYSNENFNREQKEGYRFPNAIRDIQKHQDQEREPPGPGKYYPEMPKSGTSKSFLGGPEKKKDKHNGVPSPAKGHLVWSNNDQP